MRSLHGLFDVSGMRGVRKWLDVRAPEDRLPATDERGHAALSPKITRYVEDYFAFDEAGDREGVKETLRRLIDETVAVNKVSGVPIHAHDPLPDEFLARVFPDAGAFKSAERFVADVDPDVRPMVRQQLVRLFEEVQGSEADAAAPDRAMKSAHHTGRSLAMLEDSFGRSGGEIRSPSDSLRSGASVEHSEDVGNLPAASQSGVGGQSKSLALQGPQAKPPQKPRIVKAARANGQRAPGGFDRELAEAEELAADADISIREVLDALRRNPGFDRAGDQLLREFVAAMRKYYAEGGDRAVALVGTRRVESSIYMRKRTAAYDPLTDRIYFTREFMGLSKHEKIITIIHEVLHATSTIKQREVQIGYNASPEEGPVHKEHEAYLDNLARLIAKRLGLIPQGYRPPG